MLLRVFEGVRERGEQAELRQSLGEALSRGEARAKLNPAEFGSEIRACCNEEQTFCKLKSEDAE